MTFSVVDSKSPFFVWMGVRESGPTCQGTWLNWGIEVSIEMTTVDQSEQDSPDTANTGLVLVQPGSQQNVFRK